MAAKERTAQIIVRVHPEVRRRLTVHCLRLNIHKTTLIRHLLELWMDEQDKLIIDEEEY